MTLLVIVTRQQISTRTAVSEVTDVTGQNHP